jgi:para-nitrobenzyl esterase
MNVWVPGSASSRNAPVLVVIPGGGFFAGGSSEPATDGGNLAARGIVVVSFNYRLGVFGFMAHPSLSKESPNGVLGNYGLMDQIAALQWIHDNIQAFGGDPRNVTISGSSAGGSSVLYLMVAPQARGLFTRAIAQSAALVYGPMGALRERRYGREPREATGLKLGEDIAALRALSAEELLTRSTTRRDLMFDNAGVDFWPIIDGAVLPDEPWVALEKGNFARVPLIIGTNADEGTVFTIGLPIKTAAAWHEHLAGRHPGAEAEVETTYATSDSGVRAAAVQWVNDWYFHGSTRAVARAVAAHNVPVYLYGFSRVPPQAKRQGAYHSAEIPYVFGNGFVFGKGERGFPPPFEDADRSLGAAMSGAWVQFVRTGDPNASGLPTWPRYEKSTDQHIDFGAEIRVGSGLHAQALDAYDHAFAAMRKQR